MKLSLKWLPAAFYGSRTRNLPSTRSSVCLGYTMQQIFLYLLFDRKKYMLSLTYTCVLAKYLVAMSYSASSERPWIAILLISDSFVPDSQAALWNSYHNACREVVCTIFMMVFGMTWAGREPTTCRMRGGHAYHKVNPKRLFSLMQVCCAWISEVLPKGCWRQIVVKKSEWYVLVYVILNVLKLTFYVEIF